VTVSPQLQSRARAALIRGVKVLSIPFVAWILFWVVVWLQTGELEYATGFQVGSLAIGFAVYDIDKQYVPMYTNGSYDYHDYEGIRGMLTRRELDTFGIAAVYDFSIFHVVIFNAS
jgi:hypothetical protein